MWIVMIGALGAFLIGLANGFYAPMCETVRQLSMPVSIATTVWFAVLVAGAGVPADSPQLDLAMVAQHFMGAVLIGALAHIAGLIIGERLIRA